MMRRISALSPPPRLVVAQPAGHPLYRSYLTNFEQFFRTDSVAKNVATRFKSAPGHPQIKSDSHVEPQRIVEQGHRRGIGPMPRRWATGQEGLMTATPGVALAVLIKLLKVGKIANSVKCCHPRPRHGLNL